MQQIERDVTLQMRAKAISQALVRDYAGLLRDGVVLPAIVLFADEKGRYWIGDGWHRLLAAESLALSEIEADVRPGGWRAAFLFALSANESHGARRTRADKLNAIGKALSDPETRQLSDREIGRLCRVDGKTVGQVRKEMPEGSLFDTARTGKDGKTYRTSSNGSGQVRNSAPAENGARGSVRGGAGGAKGDEVDRGAAGFNVMTEMRRVEGMLAAEFEQWPEAKRHAFCVAASNFAKLHDPEIAARTQDALDEMLEGEARG